MVIFDSVSFKPNSASMWSSIDAKSYKKPSWTNSSLLLMVANDYFPRQQFGYFGSLETKWRRFFPHPPAKLASMDYVRPMGWAIEGT